MNAAQKILESSCTIKARKIAGWQSPQCSKNSYFKPLPPGSTFVQILSVGGCHWVVASNVIGCTGAKNVRVYDSLPASKPSLQLKKNICSILRPSSKYILFDNVNVQLQPNSYDCGVFAIATATELAHAKDPIVCHWDVTAMRKHLLDCLQNKN